MMLQNSATPARVLGLYDEPFWKRLKQDGRLSLQCCRHCSTWRYPPGPVCQSCLSPDYDWKPVSGHGEILSWIVFHRSYLPEYSSPYNVVAVRLDEGPTMISNLVEEPPPGSVIGRRVALQPVEMDDGVTLPRFRLLD
ncbi:OB-fold domain-containing protein [Bosea sp. (in: a-proteobacteria)]|uniref:Zn-ribbon domain-containing OB-fold protein n=1 Tax=Bosea sp. (in: a-proteobacteria) TaxID=1871050 RepID=UPI00261CB8D6|nr:OB-fold domain-containing protein [Bosea sp. (in: a-proteobacteria)]MCO5089462.1 OB-fold domain-containing protein [Bosea sp. (in: a-proteobacteria)]